MRTMVGGLVVGAMVVAGLYTNAEHQSDQLYRTQIAACDRGNILRRESNHRIRAHVIDRDNLIRFAAAARTVRIDAYRSSHDAFDLKAARLYLRIIQAERAIRFEPVAVVDCQKVIPRP